MRRQYAHTFLTRNNAITPSKSFEIDTDAAFATVLFRKAWIEQPLSLTLERVYGLEDAALWCVAEGSILHEKMSIHHYLTLLHLELSIDHH
jgi:hypothetical protein